MLKKTTLCLFLIAHFIVVAIVGLKLWKNNILTTITISEKFRKSRITKTEKHTNVIRSLKWT